MTNSVTNNQSVQETAAYTQTQKTKVTSGRTIGNCELSEKGQKYYAELQKKFGDMDFILVSPDMKQMAEANSSAYASPNRTVVLIDTEKIEKMAEDEEYRAKYEGIIANAKNQISQMAKQLSASGANVKGYGMKINDGGTASFFAVIDKSLEAQKERIEKKAEEKAAKRKEDAKDRVEKRKEKRVEERKKADRADKSDGEDTVTITASSVEELIQKVNDYQFADRSNYVETEAEKQMGRNIDFSV